MTALATPDPRLEWLEWRRQGIGGSDAAAILGLDPWRSPMAVWLDKTGRLPLEREETEWQRWGHRLEQAVAAEFCYRTGLVVGVEQAQAQHPELPWMRATLDGLVYESPQPDGAHRRDALGLLEIKTASWRSPVSWRDGRVPDHVAVQVQHNLEVAQLDHAWLAVLLDGQELRIHELERDPDTVAALVEAEREFWQRVESGNPPPADAQPSTTEALREAYQQPELGATLELDREGRDLVEAYRLAKQEEKAAAADAQALANQLEALLGTAELGLYGGRPIVTWKRVQSERVDLKALREEHPKLVRRYTRTETARRLLLPAIPKGAGES